MKYVTFAFALSFALSAQALTEASGAYRINTSATDSCSAVRLQTGKSDRCFAVTARDCLANAKAKTGKTTVRSMEFGDQKVDYYVTPGDAALLAWKCNGNEFQVPAFTLIDYWTNKKIDLTTAVNYGRATPESTLPPQRYVGQVVGGAVNQSFIKTAGHRLDPRDIGEPLICRTDLGPGTVDKNVGEALCGVLVTPQGARYATGAATAFIRAKLKSLGVPEPKIISVDGRRVIQEE